MSKYIEPLRDQFESLGYTTEQYSFDSFTITGLKGKWEGAPDVSSLIITDKEYYGCFKIFPKGDFGKMDLPKKGYFLKSSDDQPWYSPYSVIIEVIEIFDSLKTSSLKSIRHLFQEAE